MELCSCFCLSSFLLYPSSRGLPTQKGCVCGCFYHLVYLCSMQHPQALQHGAVHCPPLIDKTCSAVCCTHRHFSGFWRSTLSLPACAQGLCVRPDRDVNTAYSRNSGGFLFLWKSSVKTALRSSIMSRRSGPIEGWKIIRGNSSCKKRFTPQASEQERKMFCMCLLV